VTAVGARCSDAPEQPSKALAAHPSRYTLGHFNRRDLRRTFCKKIIFNSAPMDHSFTSQEMFHALKMIIAHRREFCTTARH